jgi:HAD superfamily hydrolase (TIGR01450 family)
LDGSSLRLGLRCLPGSRCWGGWTCSQPPEVRGTELAGAEAAFLLSPPHPTTNSAKAANIASATSGTGSSRRNHAIIRFTAAMPVSPALSRYDQFILDLDGCVWIGDEPVPGAVEAIEALREAGKGIVFATNDSRHALEDHVRKLWRIGLQASLADIVSAGAAMQHLLAETRRGRTVFVIGGHSLHRHVSDAGCRILNGTDLASRAEMIVIGHDERLVYDDLRNAVLALRRGAELLATSRDPTLPMPDGLWPGTGAILAAVETGSDCTAAIVGKPEPQLFYTALDRLGEGRTLVVGDRLDSDVAAAAKAGLDSALVLTGGTNREQADAAKDPRPTIVAASLPALVLDRG